MSDTANRIGLSVFGAVTASFSHEIKNRMAVINEHAGLMEDHIHRTRKGIELNVERFQRSTEKIMQQVAMADEIIAHMNRFAHSVDKTCQQVDLNDAATLVTALFQRTASAHEISVNVRRQDWSEMMETSMFHVLALIWLCLKAAVDIAAAKSTLTITSEREEKESRIVIALETEPGKEIESMLSDTINMFASEVGARVRMELVKSRIVVELF